MSDPRACFPALARPWIHIAANDDAAQARPQEAQSATVYIDRSGSMVGYLAGATAAERPFHDLVGNLSAMLGMQRASTTFKAFGSKISGPLGQDEQRALMGPAYYTCGGGADCDNKESRLDNVFKEIAANKSGMAVVISDLWFSNSDIQTSALSALAEPLAQILASGRAVAIYGIEAPFDGRIFDLPYSSAPQAFKGRHPLFAIAVGTNEQIAQFHQSWLRSPSPHLAGALGDGRIKRSVFTLDPSVKSEAHAAPLSRGTDPRIEEAPVMESHENLQVQEFLLAADDAFRPAPGTVPPRWQGPAPAAFIPDAVWQGRFKSRTRVWERRASACADGDWLETAPIDRLWQAGETAGPRTFTLDPERLASELGREGTYLVAAEIYRTEVESPSPSTQWIWKWGFGAAETAPVRPGSDGASFFPTLHLGEVARLLENSLATAAQRKPSPLFGFAVVVKVER